MTQLSYQNMETNLSKKHVVNALVEAQPLTLSQEKVPWWTLEMWSIVNNLVQIFKFTNLTRGNMIAPNTLESLSPQKEVFMKLLRTAAAKRGEKFHQSWASWRRSPWAATGWRWGSCYTKIFWWTACCSRQRRGLACPRHTSIYLQCWKFTVDIE